MIVRKMTPMIVEDTDPPFGPVAVMKYDDDGLYVPASVYDDLLARHKDLAEELAWLCDIDDAWRVSCDREADDAWVEAQTSFCKARAEVERLLEGREV